MVSLKSAAHKLIGRSTIDIDAHQQNIFLFLCCSLLCSMSSSTAITLCERHAVLEDFFSWNVLRSLWRACGRQLWSNLRTQEQEEAQWVSLPRSPPASASPVLSRGPSEWRRPEETAVPHRDGRIPAGNTSGAPSQFSAQKSQENSFCGSYTNRHTPREELRYMLVFTNPFHCIESWAPADYWFCRRLICRLLSLVIKYSVLEL